MLELDLSIQIGQRPWPRLQSPIILDLRERTLLRGGLNHPSGGPQTDLVLLFIVILAVILIVKVIVIFVIIFVVMTFSPKTAQTRVLVNLVN